MDTEDVKITTMGRIIASIQYTNIGKKESMFIYTALVLRYLYIIEGLKKDELQEVANDLSLI